jgi:predicted DCC family thiol-disulfide oxidoreductase YuxK
MQTDATASASSESVVVVYDGECGICNASVQFMLRNDPRGALRFAARQSPAGQSLLVRHGFADATPNSVVLIEGERVSTRSTAVLRIARLLRFPWPLGSLFLIVPRPLRDALYDWVARNRQRWSRPAATCPMPTEEQRRRFL